MKKEGLKFCRRKLVIFGCVVFMVLAVGCSKEDENNEVVVEELDAQGENKPEDDLKESKDISGEGEENNTEDNIENKNDSDMDNNTGDNTGSNLDNGTQNDMKNENGQTGGEEGSKAGSEKSEELEGNVKSIGESNMIISKTFMEDLDDGTLLAYGPAEGSEDEVLITVYFSDSTKYEIRTVVNGGVNGDSDVTVSEGSFSDLKKNKSVSLIGHYISESEFQADAVCIYNFV